MISVHKYSFCYEENHLYREKLWMWLSHDVKYICLPEKSLSWDSRKHPAILTWRQSNVFSSFTEGRWLRAVWAVRALPLASSFPWILPAAFSPTWGKALVQNCTSLLLVLSKNLFRLTHVLSSFSSTQRNSWHRFVRNTCKVRMLVLLVSLSCTGSSVNLEMVVMLHPEVWDKCLVVLPHFQSLL